MDAGRYADDEQFAPPDLAAGKATIDSSWEVLE
jgi:hypothetical protein